MEKETSSVGVRVATLNLWGRRGARGERRSILADGFRELGPDLTAPRRVPRIAPSRAGEMDLLSPAEPLAKGRNRRGS